MPDLLSLLPTDRGFQNGLRLALLGPAITILSGILLLSITHAHPEVGLAWAMLHFVGFGVVQWAWIGPVALLSACCRCSRFALGLLLGGGALTVANGLAWLVGLTIGAR